MQLSVSPRLSPWRGTEWNTNTVGSLKQGHQSEMQLSFSPQTTHWGGAERNTRQLLLWNKDTNRDAIICLSQDNSLRGRWKKHKAVGSVKQGYQPEMQLSVSPRITPWGGAERITRQLWNKYTPQKQGYQPEMQLSVSPRITPWGGAERITRQLWNKYTFQRCNYLSQPG